MRTRLFLACMAVVLLAGSPALSDVFTNVPEAAGYRLVYDLSIPALQGSFNSNAIPYSTNNSGTIGADSYSRIGYYLELTGSGDPTRPNGWVYASFDTPGIMQTANTLGVPSNGPNGSGLVTNAAVANLHVFSNVGSISTGNFTSGGKLEFWPSNYGPGPNPGDVFDHNDDSFSGASGHGSMQIHNTSVPQTLFGYSDWGGNGPGSPSEIGIGTNPGPTGQPDWTFSDSGSIYTVRNMQIVVNNTPLPPTLRIMPLGDSITAGYNTNGGYRIPLQQSLQAAGLNPNFVGAQTDNSVGMADPEHEGHSGFTINGIQALPIAGRISTYQPDITLLHIGTNDISGGDTAANMALELETLIDSIMGVTLANGEQTKLLVAQIVPRVGDNTVTQAYNALIPGIVAAHQLLGEPVYLVDMFNALEANNTDIPDGIHPGDGGYQKMADTWFPAILAVVPEPSSAALLGSAAVILCARLRRRRTAKLN